VVVLTVPSVCDGCAQDAAIAKSELELKRRTDEIERKTRETDNLNRKLERLLAAQPGVRLTQQHLTHTPVQTA
jgi:hypothetical protein